MARVRTRRLYWNSSASTDVSGYSVYRGPAADTDFLAKVDAGQVTPLGTTPKETTEFVLTAGLLPEGNHQFAVCSMDVNGNYSDPYQNAGWVNVPLDLTAPLPPTTGGID